MNLLELDDVTVRYGEAVAVDGVSPCGCAPRARRAHRAERGRQDLAAQRRLRRDSRGVGSRARRGGRRHRSDTRCDRAPRSQPGARGSSRLRDAACRGQSAAGCVRTRLPTRDRLVDVALPPFETRRARPARAHLRPAPQAARAARATGRADVGRRAADGRDRACAHGAPTVARDRRALARSCSHARAVAGRVPPSPQRGRRASTILLVDQSASLAFSLCERAYVLETGRVALEGASRDLVGRSEVRSAYLGGGPDAPS